MRGAIFFFRVTVLVACVTAGGPEAAARSAADRAQAPASHDHEPPDGHTTQPATAKPEPAAPPQPDRHVHGDTEQKAAELPDFIPRLTDEDRRAAFPDVEGHAVHDRAIHSFVLFDQLEWQAADGASGVNLDGKGWFGRDIDRIWFRAEGASEEGRLGEAEAHLLYGRQVSRWWDIVGGIRQDLRPGPAQTWAAVGVQGLAPYWFEIEATGYVGAGGRTHARVEVEYELLFTNRLVLQPVVEVNLHGKSDEERGIGAGLSSSDAGFRLRYEFRRELAPYIGITWARKHGRTADFAREHGERTGGARLLAGLRLWF